MASEILKRSFEVNRLGAEIAMAFWKEVGKHDLTYAEIMYITGELNMRAAGMALRSERHAIGCDAKADELCGKAACRKLRKRNGL